MSTKIIATYQEAILEKDIFSPVEKFGFSRFHLEAKLLLLIDAVDTPSITVSRNITNEPCFILASREVVTTFDLLSEEHINTLHFLLEVFEGNKKQQQALFRILMQYLYLQQSAQNLGYQADNRIPPGRSMLGKFVAPEAFNGLADQVRDVKQLIDNDTIKTTILKYIDLSPLQFVVRTSTDLSIIRNKHQDRLYTEDAVEQVLERFSAHNTDLLVPLTDNELLEIGEQYQKVFRFGKAITTEPQAQLLSRVEKLKNKKEWAVSDRCEFFAIAREQLKRNYKGIYPYNTQMITVLALVNRPDIHKKGRIAQVATGEGKSLQFAMVNAYWAVQGLPTDYSTTNDTLAIRDKENFEEFYKSLGIKASNLTHDHFDRESFSGMVVYGTCAWFQHTYLYEKLLHKKVRVMIQKTTELNKKGEKVDRQRMVERPLSIATVDEVDNLLQDLMFHSAQISSHKRVTYDWIYNPILTFIKTKHRETNGLKDSDDLSIFVPELKLYLKSIAFKKDHSVIDSFSDKELTRWLKAAKEAEYKYKKNYHYVVMANDSQDNTNPWRNKKVVIVDYDNTGALLHGSRWIGSVHQFVEAKEGIIPEPETYLGASISKPGYYNRYKRIYAMTGTAGTLPERAELEAIYDLQTFDVPTHHPTIREDLSTVIINAKFDSEEFLSTILNMVVIESKKGRPINITCQTIEQSNITAKYFDANNVEYQLYNEVQKQNSKEILEQAGVSAQITISTQNSARGTDIILTKESLAAGGLFNMYLGFPLKYRNEVQIRGRAGRQGQPGASRLVIPYEETFMAKLRIPLDIDSAELTFEMLALYRKAHEESEVDKRKKDLAKEDKILEIQNKLFSQSEIMHIKLRDTNYISQLMESIYNSKVTGWLFRNIDSSIIEEVVTEGVNKLQEGKSKLKLPKNLKALFVGNEPGEERGSIDHQAQQKRILANSFTSKFEEVSGWSKTRVIETVKDLIITLPLMTVLMTLQAITYQCIYLLAMILKSMAVSLRVAMQKISLRRRIYQIRYRKELKLGLPPPFMFSRKEDNKTILNLREELLKIWKEGLRNTVNTPKELLKDIRKNLQKTIAKDILSLVLVSIGLYKSNILEKWAVYFTALNEVMNEQENAVDIEEVINDFIITHEEEWQAIEHHLKNPQEEFRKYIFGILEDTTK